MFNPRPFNMLSTSILGIFAVIYPIGVVFGLAPHGYMTHYYYNHKPVFVNDSMILELTNKFLSETPGERFLTCDVNIVTSANRKLLVHFLSLEISYADKDIDRLHIYDYKSSGEAVRISPPQGLYGIWDPYYTGRGQGVADYLSSGNRLKLDYQGRPTLAYNGFKILITSYRDARGDCGRGYIRCNRKSLCMPASTWCDGNPNCGVADESDEANCDQGPSSTWNPLDGQVTAVVAAAVSCTLFFLTAATLALVVIRLNNRDVINQNNITVEFKKKRTKRQASKAHDYDPPAYEVVIGAPPPYQLVASPDDTGSDVSDDEAVGGLACGGGHEYTTIIETARVRQAAHNGAVANSNNIRVTCDIHGDIVESAERPKQNGTQPNGCMELTKYRLCSQAPTTNGVLRQDSRRAKSNSLEIEVLHSGSESEQDDCEPAPPVCNVKANMNGVHQNGQSRDAKLNGHAGLNGQAHSSVNSQSALNGHARVSYSASQTADDDVKVEFVGNEP